MSTILIADDDPLAAAIFGGAFKRAGHSVYVVNDGIDVLPALKVYPIDCLVLDCLMPGVTGIEVLRRLRAKDRYCLLPIIMLTARSAPNDRHVADNSRVDLYCTKNSDPDWVVFQAEDLIANKVTCAPVVSDPWNRATGPVRSV
ncbi:response regulator [Parerythrobacter aurantius]|uniref:response regulator n=1 Tax=Parerythrobacter aurantius TaxID=3127706 RepID=UPI003248DA28